MYSEKMPHALANQGHRKPHIVIIGGGIIGVNCALQLQESGAQCTLIDMQGIGEGCSGGNAGHLATEQIFPLADPTLLRELPSLWLHQYGPLCTPLQSFVHILPWLARFIRQMLPSARQHNSNALHALNQHAMQAYLTLAQRYPSLKPLLKPDGNLLVFEQASRERVAQCAKPFQQAGIELQLLNKQQIRQQEPNLSHTIQHAIEFKNTGWVLNPKQFTQAIAHEAQQLGTHSIQAHVDKIEAHPHHVSLTMTRTSADDKHSSVQPENIHADLLVIANGIHAKPLVETLGYRVPLQAERGYHLDFELQNTISRPIASAERKIIMTPMNHGLRIAGLVELATFAHPADFKRTQILYHHARSLLVHSCYRNTPYEVGSVWMGQRPSLPDSLPVIARCQRNPNILFAFGHQHLGLTQAAITGRLIRQLAFGETPDINVAPYSLNRFN